MKNKTAIIGIGILVLVSAVYIFVNSGSAVSIGNNTPSNGAVQVVKLSVVSGNYVFNPATVKKDIPVRIEGDIANMPGCSKSVVMSGFNIRKTLSDKDNIIEFTPNKAGTFNIACSMNMYKGTFTVLESDGSKPAYVEEKAATATGASCGSSGGGCGCGGGIK